MQNASHLEFATGYRKVTGSPLPYARIESPSPDAAGWVLSVQGENGGTAHRRDHPPSPRGALTRILQWHSGHAQRRGHDLTEEVSTTVALIKGEVFVF